MKMSIPEFILSIEFISAESNKSGCGEETVKSTAEKKTLVMAQKNDYYWDRAIKDRVG